MTIFNFYFLIIFDANHILILTSIMFHLSNVNCLDCNECINGKCIYEFDNSSLISESNKTPKYKCKCFENWSGINCDNYTCSGRIRLLENSGRIIDATGNYTTDTKCTWLIGNGNKNPPLRLQIKEFSTECGWDNLYIYDGTSIKSPLVAVVSGIMSADEIKYFPELTLTSGFGYIHFYSDAAYNMKGFVIDYWQSNCASNCSNHGNCLANGSCICFSNWMGYNCDTPECPNNCSNQGYCMITGCQCVSGFRGDDCSLAEKFGFLEKVIIKDGTMPEPSASHASVLINDEFYIVGGYNFGSNDYIQISKFNVKLKTWIVIESYDAPKARYAHSVVYYSNENKLLMIGGVAQSDVLNEVYSFSLNDRLWNLFESTDGSFLIETSGHTSHLINGALYVIFGHNPIYGYLNIIQTFHLSKLSWSILKTYGAAVQGTYGHSSLYDSQTNCILVHGGYTANSVPAYYISDALLSFNLSSRSWKVLMNSGYGRYLHSANIIGRFMFVFGGNTHNDTSISQGAKCYSNQILAYDINCNQWHNLESPPTHLSAARYGHSSFVYSEDVYIYGGYNSLLLNDMLKYYLGRCKSSNLLDCITPIRGTRCRFVDNLVCMQYNETVEKLQYKNIQDYKEYQCSDAAKHSPNPCVNNYLKTCTACVVNSESCIWCGETCQSPGSANCDKFSSSERECLRDFDYRSAYCVLLHNCHACNLDANCIWNVHESHCNFVSGGDVYNRTCDQAPCSSHVTCENCTRNLCMWCSSMRRCIESNSYIISFPYGLCMEWMTNHDHCPATRCEDHRSCLPCLYNPACGFCDDGTDMGAGGCMVGDYALSDVQYCSRDRWIYDTCPLCQCNGHSRCLENTSTCLFCNDNTQGENCEACKPGYYANKNTEGVCTACECSKDDFCNSSTGKCLCHTRGAKGKNCQDCDSQYFFMFNENGIGSCYYQILLNQLVTFDLPKVEITTRMNLFNIPPTRDSDVTFNMSCNGSLSANITLILRQGNHNEILIPNMYCPLNYMVYRISCKDYIFGDNTNSTFFLYISNIQCPMNIMLSISQGDNLDLLKFFITFFSCFFSLLLIAFIAWKMKQKYDLYRRSQRHLQEMAEMARRPFSTSYVLVGEDEDDIKDFLQTNTDNSKNTDCKHTIKRRKKKKVPTATLR